MPFLVGDGGRLYQLSEMVKLLSEGELLQPRGTWMRDDDKGVFCCVDGLRPVVMLIEAVK